MVCCKTKINGVDYLELYGEYFKWSDVIRWGDEFLRLVNSPSVLTESSSIYDYIFEELTPYEKFKLAIMHNRFSIRTNQWRIGAASMGTWSVDPETGKMRASLENKNKRTVPDLKAGKVLTIYLDIGDDRPSIGFRVGLSGNYSGLLCS